MYYLLFSQTLLATIYMFANLIAITIAFMVIHSPPDKIKDVLKASPRLVGRDVLFSLPIFLTFFFLFPRFSTPWGRYAGESQVSIGFSESVHPGDLARLAKSEDPAFRASFLNNMRMLPKDLYWRGTVLDETDGWNWHRAKIHNEFASKKIASPNPATPVASLAYQLTLEPKFEKHLFSLENTTQIEWLRSDQHNEINHFEDEIFSTTWPVISKAQYVGHFFRSKRSSSYMLHPIDALSATDFDRYTHLPKSFSSSVRKLSQRLTQNDGNPSEKAKTLLRYFSEEHFQYSLNAPEMASIDSFLFGQRIGFCEHYAAAFALLMRAAGVPARVVVGFQGGEVNEYADYILVRDNHAHAWVEIFESSKGWIRVDPTTAVNQARITIGSSLEGSSLQRNFISRFFYSSQMLWDSINLQYMQLLMNYDFNSQKTFIDFATNLTLKKYLLLLFAGLLTAVFLFLINFQIKKAQRHRTTIGQQLFWRFIARLKNYGIERKPDEGPVQFAERASGLLPEKTETIKEIVAKYINWEYRSRPPTSSEVLDIKNKISKI
jgi:hypothetical protein